MEECFAKSIKPGTVPGNPPLNLPDGEHNSDVGEQGQEDTGGGSIGQHMCKHLSSMVNREEIYLVKCFSPASAITDGDNFRN